MIKFVNECCDCAVPGYPCLGASCPRRHVRHYFCDVCGEQLDNDRIYEVDDTHYCEDCLMDTFRKDISNEYPDDDDNDGYDEYDD